VRPYTSYRKGEKLGVRHDFILSVALGAREVDDDLGLVFEFWNGFVLDGGEGAEEELQGVGHDGGRGGVDFFPGLEFIEFGRGSG